MRSLVFSTVSPYGMTALTVLAVAIAFGISVTQPGLALGMIIGIALLVTAFLSTRAAFYILIISMLLSPEIMVGELGRRATLERGVTLRLDDFLLIIVGFSWLARIAIYKELGFSKRTPLNLPILYYMLTCIISTLMGILAGRVNPMTGFFFVLKYLEFFFVYFMVINTITDRTQIKHLVLLSFITCFLVSLYAIIQIPGGGRATLPFEGKVGEPNTLGGYLVFMLSLVGGLFLHVPHRKGKIMLTSLAGVIVVALLATQSRSSYLAVLATFGAFSILNLLRRQKLGLLAFLAALLLLSPFLVPSFVKERIAYTFIQPRESGQIKILRVQLDTSTSARILSWQEGFRDFKEHPLLGYGVTGYGFLDAQYPRVLLETGLLGLLAFLYLVYQLWQQVFLIHKTASDPYEKGLALGFWLGFIGLLVHAIGANTFIIVRIMEPFWLFAGMVMMIPKLGKGEEG